MPYSFREIERRLTKLGYKIVRQGKGSHVIFSNGQVTFPVPRHSGKDISPGVERNILKLIGMTSEQFRRFK
ncbi:MAG: type II toxin-antitoxin system HicA family toxin [Nitrospinae bacterium]|nr:type II toxin-antitoxin system HicA family toxin [Nitrospinota bacterium]MBF0635515.1 type II toxin-antitoxin system HicA family toxin [Nitrospinota bacterium]